MITIFVFLIKKINFFILSEFIGTYEAIKKLNGSKVDKSKYGDEQLNAHNKCTEATVN